MAEQIIGLFFYLCGAGLVIHNKTLVRNSLESMPGARREAEAETFFNRIPCVLAGVTTLGSGLLMMLYPTGG